MTSVGERLKSERKRLGYDQTAFGAIANINRPTQSNYERGKRSPSVDYLAAIEKVGVDIAYIVTGERGGDSVLKSLKPTDRAAAVLRHVVEVQESLGVEFTKEQIQILMGYTYEHCPTIEALKSFVESAFQLTGQKLPNRG